jgi:hypothetical protein
MSRFVGDTVGTMIDFTEGTISVYLNGEYLGQTFTEAENGPRPDPPIRLEDGSVKTGPVWGEGFYPCVSLYGGESVTINLGQEPFKKKPEDCISVLQVTDGASREAFTVQARTSSRHVPGDQSGIRRQVCDVPGALPLHGRRG